MIMVFYYLHCIFFYKHFFQKFINDIVLNGENNSKKIDSCYSSSNENQNYNISIFVIKYIQIVSIIYVHLSHRFNNYYSYKLNIIL